MAILKKKKDRSNSVEAYACRCVMAGCRCSCGYLCVCYSWQQPTAEDKVDGKSLQRSNESGASDHSSGDAQNNIA